MSILHKSASLAAVGLVASMFAVPHFALADTMKKPADQVVSASQKADMDKTTDAMKLSQEGFDTMREVHAARLAIFNGQPDVATDMLSKANADLEKVNATSVAFFAKQGSGFTPMKTSTDVNHQAETRWIPIDGRMAIAEDFVSTPKKAEHIARANSHLKKGDHAKALQELKLGEIDVSYTRLMMPLDITLKHVNTATQLVKQGKYYEANLALKAAEDGIVLDTVALLDTPAQASN